MVGAEMRAARRRIRDRAHHHRMVVPEQQRAMAAEIIDVFVAIDVPFARPGGALDVNSVRVQVPPVMRDPARQQRRRLARQLGRA